MKTLLPIFCSISALCASLVFADGEAEAPKSPEFSLAFTGALNDGNTEDKSGNLATEFKDAWEGIGSYNIGADGTITRTTLSTTETLEDGTKETHKEKNTTAKNGKVFGEMLFDICDLPDKNLPGKFSAYINGSAFADEIADVDYRYLVGPGIAFSFEKGGFNLAVEIGISPMWEKIAGEFEYYTMFREALRCEYNFANGAKIYAKFELLADCEKFFKISKHDWWFDNEEEKDEYDAKVKYIETFEAGVDSPISGKLSLRISLKDTYNSQPGEDHEKNDLSLNAGIVVKL